MQKFGHVFLLFLLAAILSVLTPSVAGQGQGAGGETQQALIDENGKVHPKYEGMAKKLQSTAPIDPVVAVEIAVLLEAAKSDPETLALVDRMRSGTGAGPDLDAFIKEATPLELVKGMSDALSELKAVEILFEDPQKAVTEMHKEGLIEKKRLDFYKKNPEELAADTRKGIYFSFVALAAAGGYI